MNSTRGKRNYEGRLFFKLQCLAFSICFLWVANGQAGSFLNLNFEDYDPATKTLPGWRLSNPLTQQNEFGLPLGIPPGVTEGPLAFMVDVARLPDLRLNGKYALELAPPGSWTLSQRGELPQDAKLVSWINIGPVQMNLRIDDQDISVNYSYDSLFPHIHGYAQADVWAYAGKNVEFKMIFGTVPPQFLAPGQNYFSVIDDIRFSPIPEPSTLTFGLFGVLMVFALWPTLAREEQRRLPW